MLDVTRRVIEALESDGIARQVLQHKYDEQFDLLTNGVLRVARSIDKVRVEKFEVGLRRAWIDAADALLEPFVPEDTVDMEMPYSSGDDVPDAITIEFDANLELEAQIAANPDDISSYQVCGDWLAGNGHVIGAIASIQLKRATAVTDELREAEEKILRENVATLFGPTHKGEDARELELDPASEVTEVPEGGKRKAVDAIGSPDSRARRCHAVDRLSDEAPELARAVEYVARAPCARTLRAFQLGGGEHELAARQLEPPGLPRRAHDRKARDLRWHARARRSELPEPAPVSGANRQPR